MDSVATIYVRNVDDDDYTKLRVIAAQRHVSVAELVRQLIASIVAGN